MSDNLDTMHLAFYKGPASDFLHKVSHWGITLWTNSEYSHVELVIDGECYSSSARDKGVRKKQIDLDSGRWDLVPVKGDKAAALAFFEVTAGLQYDWAGIGRYVLPWLPNADLRWYCSEWCARALRWAKIELTPGECYDLAQSD